MGYFVVHAPRPTGKTTALRALAERLTASGRFAALHVSCETGEAAGDDFGEAQRAILSQLRQNSELDFDRLLREFTDFWQEHGEVLTAGVSYHEVAPQLALMAFLQRVINGGGFVAREYGVGRGRIDLLVRWPYQEGGQRRWQRHALDLKVWREGETDPLSKGLTQLDTYLERLGLDEDVLVIFDRREKAESAGSRTRFEQAQAPSGRKVTVLRA